MANSTHLLTDMNTAITAGPTAATSALSITASGTIMDYPGNCRQVYAKLAEAEQLLTAIVGDTDANDPSLATLQGVLGSLS